VCLAPFEPTIVITRMKDDRHAIVHFRSQIVRIGGDDGEGLEPLSVYRVLPCIPETGKANGWSSVSVYAYGLFVLGSTFNHS